MRGMSIHYIRDVQKSQYKTHTDLTLGIYIITSNKTKSVYLAGLLYEFSLQINIKTFTAFMEEEICKAGFY